MTPPAFKSRLEDSALDLASDTSSDPSGIWSLERTKAAYDVLKAHIDNQGTGDRGVLVDRGEGESYPTSNPTRRFRLPRFTRVVGRLAGFATGFFCFQLIATILQPTPLPPHLWPM